MYLFPKQTRKMVLCKQLIDGNATADLLGIVAPYSYCSSIPLFLRFVENGVSSGKIFPFLIAVTMLNEVATMLIFGLSEI